MIYQALLLLIPAAIANGVPPLFAKIFPYWNYPLDFNLKFKGERLFGDHKTVRGFVLGTLCAHAAFALLFQQNWYYSQLNTFNLAWHFGLATGAAALVGDAIKSFFKRRVGIAPGKSWVPFDQIDWILVYLAVLALYVNINFTYMLISVIVGFAGHIIAKVFGFVIGVNETTI